MGTVVDVSTPRIRMEATAAKVVEEKGKAEVKVSVTTTIIPLVQRPKTPRILKVINGVQPI
ncbi:MAG: hypothetical protein ACKPKO_62070, partial [Candidatus Fonsibacter sp.]